MPKFVGVPSIYPKLLELRASKTAEFKNNKYLKETTKLRYYQVIGSLHMMMLERMILGDATGTGKCISGDSYINTNFGLMKLKDIVIRYGLELKEDTLYELSEKLIILSDNESANASHLYYSGKNSGLKILTHQGYELTGLKHHPIYCPFPEDSYFKFKRLDELLLVDYICINRKGIFPETYYPIEFNYEGLTGCKYYKIPKYLDESLAELLGYYVSEGNSPNRHHFQITQFYDEIRDRIRYLIKTLFNYEETGKNKKFDESILVHSVQLISFFKFLGVAIDGKSGDQVIPKSILQSKKSVIRAFLRGYFEGDGSVKLSHKLVSCSSKSEILIKELQLILLQFGIISRRKIKMVKTKSGRKPYWILYFCGLNIDIFKKEIGFVSARKNKDLDKLILKRNTNNDIIPYGHILLKKAMTDVISYLKNKPEHKRFSIKGSGWKGLVGYNYKHKLESYIYGKKQLTYNGLQEFLDKIEKFNLCDIVSNYSLLKDIYNKNIFFDKIEKIYEIEDDFYDLHVPSTHNFTGNGFINHNTLQTIAAYTFLKEKDSSLKFLVVCPKSATYQWEEEFKKFTQGISVKVLTNEYNGCKGYDARILQYQEFSEDVLIMNYNPVLNEYDRIKDVLGSDYMICFDEAVAFKNKKTKTHFACKYLADNSKRVYGLSATIIKNDLEEVWGVYNVIVPGLFGKITNFRKNYCKQKLMKLQIKGRTRYIPKTIGYKNLKEFKQVLDPYFLIRRKEEVANELPKLISKKVVLEMLPEQKKLYGEALAGIVYEEKVRNEYYEISEKIRDGYTDKKTLKKYKELKDKYDKFLTPEGKKRGKLAALTYCQMVSNGPQLIGQQYESSKELEFVRLMKEEFLTDKVILYTRFRSGIPFLEVLCNRNRINYTQIHGGITSDRDRKNARLKFQNDPDCNLIFITQAGSAALNLQAANVLIFYDTPWSYGDLVQTIGRAQRIGSLREHIVVTHLINKKTIDTRVMNRVSSKKNLSDEILGDTAKGALDFTEREKNVIDDLFYDLMEDAKQYDE